MRDNPGGGELDPTKGVCDPAEHLRSYSKTKFELQSNLSKILPIYCKFTRSSNPT